MIGATVLVSSAALLLWFFLFDPNLADLLAQIPQLHPLALAGIGLAFAGCQRARDDRRSSTSHSTIHKQG